MRHICCGALNVYIVSGGNPDATAVAARIGYGEPWCFLAFGQIPVERLIVVDETRFIALTAARNGNPKWMATFDARQRKQCSPTVEVMELSPDSKVVVTRERDRVLHLRGSSCRCWSLPDLTELWARDFPGMTIQDATERDDRRIIVKASRSSSDPIAQAPCVLTLTADGEQVEVHEIPPEKRSSTEDGKSPFRLSAGGRWLHRVHDGSVLVTDSAGSPIRNLDRLAEAHDEQLVEAIKSVWICGVQELWTATPVQLHARVVVRSISLFDALSEKPCPEAVHAQHRLQAAQQHLLDLEDQGADKEEYEVVRAEIAHLRKLQNDFSKARSTLKWLARLAELAPHDGWEPGDSTLFERLPQSESRWAKQRFLQPLEVARGVVEAWDAQDQGFTVRFPDGYRRRVTLTGELGDLEPASTDAFAPTGIPPDVKAPAARFLRAASVPTVRLGRLDEYNCVRAIEDVIARIRTGVHKVVWGRQLTLRFALPEGELTERQFFDFVGGNCENAVASVRRLLAAYDEAAKSNDVWSDEGVGALGYAALALARLDPKAYTAFDGYFSRRSARHESFGTKYLLPAIAERTNSFGDIGALRFALLRLPEETLRHDAGHLLAPLIIRGARTCCSPRAFLKEVERIARIIMWQAEIEASALTENVGWKEVRNRMAMAEARAHEGLLTPLLRAAEPLNDWDFSFIAAARRRRSTYPHRAERWFAAWQGGRRATNVGPATSAVSPIQRHWTKQGQHRIDDTTRARRQPAAPQARTATNAQNEEKIAR